MPTPLFPLILAILTPPLTMARARGFMTRVRNPYGGGAVRARNLRCMAEKFGKKGPGWGEKLGVMMAGVGLGLGVGLGMVQPATAEYRSVGEFGTSGIFLKDTLKIESIDDPKVEGVTLYISDFSIPITEKFANGFMEPSAIGVTCARTGPLKMKDSMSKSTSGEEVFSESRSLFFGKAIRVRRIYDKARETLLYIGYSDRLDKNSDSNKSRFKSAICAIPLNADPGAGIVPVAQEN
ncbi:hypothetical protein AAMO2058_000410500 [Amorphochlora amoebiformis]